MRFQTRVLTLHSTTHAVIASEFKAQARQLGRFQSGGQNGAAGEEYTSYPRTVGRGLRKKKEAQLGARRESASYLPISSGTSYKQAPDGIRFYLRALQKESWTASGDGGRIHPCSKATVDSIVKTSTDVTSIRFDCSSLVDEQRIVAAEQITGLIKDSNTGVISQRDGTFEVVGFDQLSQSSAAKRSRPNSRP